MPLVTLAYAAVAAGLLLGFGGEVLPGVAAGAAVIVVGAWTRSLVRGALGLLVCAGILAAWSTRRADESCAATIEAEGGATVRLREQARKGASARGFAVGNGCRVAVRLRLSEGSADAGALVRVLGTARREGARVSMTEARVRVLRGPGHLARWRARAGRVIDSLYGAQAPLARALVLADESDISPAVRRAFADAGIIHMLSVSGLHVAVLAEAVVVAMLLLGVPSRKAEVVAVMTIGGFVALVGAPAPAVRSAAMYAALVTSRRLQRPTSPWALLALGAALPLAQPRVVNDIGYHLSVAGMAALVASGRLVSRLPRGSLPAWAGRLGRETAATLVASAVTAPIVAWHFGRVSLAAPVTNLAAAPLFGLAQPALFFSMLLAPIRPAARLIADGTSIVLAGIERVGAAGASIPWSAVDVQPSLTTALLLAAASGGFLTACSARHWAAPVLLTTGALAAALWWPVLRPAGTGLEVHLIDVGQGDAIALRTPRWRWILVDAGDAWRDSDAGERIVAPYLRRRGGEVAVMLLSHPHADHIGGAASVIGRLATGVVLDGGHAEGSQVYAGLLASTRKRRVPWRMARAGDVFEVDGVKLTVLAPDSREAAAARDANEASVVVMAEYRGVRVLLTGDAERDVELRLAQRLGGRLRADILKVGHHGSSTSTTAPLLDQVAPRLALVSVGAGNRYGHPSADVIRSLHSRGAQVLRTDHSGSIVVMIDGSDALDVRTDEARWSLRRRSAALHPRGTR